jgi:hypothetical protein
MVETHKLLGRFKYKTVISEYQKEAPPESTILQCICHELLTKLWTQDKDQ